MKISIVTPVFDRPDFLDDTINSILSQKGSFDLEYIIQNGGTDIQVNSKLDIWQAKVDSGYFEGNCKSLRFEVYNEPDKNMYDGLNKGFRKTTGDIMAWLNSDDMYHPYALQTVNQVFSKFQNIYWLTGIPNSYNKFGSRSGYDKFPNVYSQFFLEKGYYDVTYFKYGFNWIQQESTFWRRELWTKHGRELRTDLKFASDFHLWLSFAKYSDLVRIDSFLGGFRVHDNQLTNDPHGYSRELPQREELSEGYKALKKLIDSNYDFKKCFFNEKSGEPYISLLGLKFEHLVGRSVCWDFNNGDWKIVLKSIFD